MSVEVTFQPAGISGLVAEGTYLIEAARRMGVRLARDCQGPACASCVVYVMSGDSLLSAPTEHETNTLGAQEVAQKQRLACQAIIERDGEIVVQVLPARRPDAEDMRKTFGQLPLGQKLITLVQLETITMSEALDEISAKSLSIGEKLTRVFRQRKKASGKE
ncbi:MAG TPA: 2Fe-2S iron-sulfur cluster-binding protein [Pyrinomonadaceae bacterium]|nr:2Fe-2S iron-sulfur cluster-binding protein [Pyrinomonadaceae bacterium]